MAINNIKHKKEFFRLQVLYLLYHSRLSLHNLNYGVIKRSLQAQSWTLHAYKRPGHVQSTHELFKVIHGAEMSLKRHARSAVSKYWSRLQSLPSLYRYYLGTTNIQL